MEKEEKQIEFLNRLYTNIESFKSLRFKIPATISGFIVAISGYVLTSENIPKDNFQRVSVVVLILLIGIFSIVAYSIIHYQYKRIADEIHYLWGKLGMLGTDFLKAEGLPENNDYQKAPKIFLIGYFSIGFFTIIGIILILIK